MEDRQVGLSEPADRGEATSPPSPRGTVERLTPAGRGAVATLRLTGPLVDLDAPPRPFFRAASGLPLGELPLNRIAFGTVGEAPAEETVVCRIRSDVLELHCHGGDAAVGRIVADLAPRGFVLRDAVWPGETRFERECAEALSRAQTQLAANLLLAQQAGLLRRAVEQVAAARPDRSLAAERLAALWRWRRAGLRLTQPFRVALVGRPNVGKSSLINALVGYERSIVFDAPGTTRDVVTAETALAGWAVQLADTAGFRTGAGELETMAMERARAWLAEADLVLLVLDRSQPLTDEDRDLYEAYPEALCLVNKVDLPSAWPGENEFCLGDGARSHPRLASLAVSAVTGCGMEELQRQIMGRLLPEPVTGPVALPFTPRQVAHLEQFRLALDEGDWDRVELECWRVIGD
ncbi:MAG: GTPase [Planctomycetaceae bacterium]